MFISESALINLEAEQHPIDDVIWNPPMESHHDLVFMNRMCTDWSRAESWAGLWIVTDRSDPKGFKKLHLLLKWGSDLIHSFSGDKTAFFPVWWGLAVRKETVLQLCLKWEREWVITGPLVQLCWFTSPCWAPQRPADTQHAHIHSSSGVYACVSLPDTHAHIREEQRVEHPRTVWGGGWWMALSLCHMATHHASTVCLSIVSSASPMHSLMIPRTTPFNGWVQTGS